ncbi:MAG: DUF1326 domain-containing protein [Bryobacteraceae bacterium]
MTLPTRLELLVGIVAVSTVVFAQQKPPARPWHIKGQLTEACTCAVPCTCNFGERPSPHDYCYAMWSYWIQEGTWEQVKLNDLKVGGVDGPAGILALLDERAEGVQRAAMENIWHALSGRLLCLMRLWPFKGGGAEPKPGQPAQQSSIIRTRYPDRRFLGFEYVPIEQAITGRGSRLAFSNRGGFEAVYIFGRDPAQPITVTNIVSWPVPVSIKGKTVFLKYKDKYNQLEYEGTNSNQGKFDLSHTQPGATPMAPK